MKKIFTVLIAMVLATSYGVLNATVLDKASPEYIQLQAMGYEIDPSPPSDVWTVAKGFTAKIAISQNASGITMARFFERGSETKTLTQDEMLQFLTAVNQVNLDTNFQTALDGSTLMVVLYHTGPYNAKAFASLVRQLEGSNSIFDKYPLLLKLMKK